MGACCGDIPVSMHQGPHLLLGAMLRNLRRRTWHQQEAVLGDEWSMTEKPPHLAGPSERMCCMIAPFISIFLRERRKRMKARTLRSGSLPRRLLLGYSEISRM